MECDRLWPDGSEYCGTCGKTLGARVCPNGHRNSLDVVVCLKCGSRNLSQGVRTQESDDVGGLVSVGTILLITGLAALFAVFVAPVIFAAIKEAIRATIGALVPLLSAFVVVKLIISAGSKS